MKKYALIGNTVQHSLSPVIHQYWMAEHGIKGIYVAMSFQGDLRRLIERMIVEGYEGFNITAPYKEHAVDVCDYLEGVADRIRVVNTIKYGFSGEIEGHNTDVYGFVEGSVINGVDRYKGKTAMVLGCGGAAKAVIAGLVSQDIEHIIVISQQVDRASEFMKTVPIEYQVWEWKALQDSLHAADFIINATPLGTRDNPPLYLDFKNAKKDAIIIDINYGKRSRLIQDAIENGNACRDGLDMLLYQAQKSFYLWHGIKPLVSKDIRKFVMGVRE